MALKDIWLDLSPIKIASFVLSIAFIISLQAWLLPVALFIVIGNSYYGLI